MLSIGVQEVSVLAVRHEEHEEGADCGEQRTGLYVLYPPPDVLVGGW